ncbi:MAG: YegP family protein [Bacteroidota bacterium]
MFEIYQSEKNEKYYFRLKAKNGQVIMTSQGYAAKSGAKNGVESVKKNASDADSFERKVASNGKHHFNLLAANKQIIGSSQMYASKDGMENGIKSVMTNAGSAEVKDLS